MKLLSDCRVLIVDDAKANIDILIEGLRLDYKLSVALSGDMALQVAARTPPDLVLLDIVMPVMDGYEVCRRMRASPELSDVPIVFLSALDEAKDKAKGFEVGANDYVTKPFEMLEVKARVRALLKAKAYSDAVKEQMAGEMRVAREIQMGMLPRDFSSVRRDYGVEVAARIEPTKEVGGDLYGVFPAGPDRLVLVVGDVSGKGIPAALFMVRASTIVSLLARRTTRPRDILEALNNELAADNPSCMFVTMICAIYERKSGRVEIANGGQNLPILLRPGETPRWAAPALGTALGLDTDVPFAYAELTLAPGDALLLYTDGVTEAMNPASECYGDERLLDLAGRPLEATADAFLDRLVASVRTFAAGAAQSDDIAALVLRVPAP